MIGNIELMNWRFFDEFTNNYDMLFVSSYGPDESHNTREKLFEIKFDRDVNKFNKNNR